jgi:hypothetical protein
VQELESRRIELSAQGDAVVRARESLSRDTQQLKFDRYDLERSQREVDAQRSTLKVRCRAVLCGAVLFHVLSCRTAPFCVACVALSHLMQRCCCW